MVNKPPISVPAMPDLSPAIQLQYEKAEPIKESDSYLEIWEKVENRKPDRSLREGKNQYTRSFEEDWEYFKESYLGYSKNPGVQKISIEWKKEKRNTGKGNLNAYKE